MISIHKVVEIFSQPTYGLWETPWYQHVYGGAEQKLSSSALAATSKTSPYDRFSCLTGWFLCHFVYYFEDDSSNDCTCQTADVFQLHSSQNRTEPMMLYGYAEAARFTNVIHRQVTDYTFSLGMTA